MEQLSTESREAAAVPRVSDAAVSLSSSVAHVDVHAFFVDLVSSAFAREESPVQQFVAHDDVHSSPTISPLGPPVETYLLSDYELQEHSDSLSIVTHVVGLHEDSIMVLVVHENTHISPRIQHDMEL